MWCVGEINADYVERREDVLATYEKPGSPAEPVICLDEKPVSLHAEVREPIPAQPGSPAKRDSEYKRCGTANLFCAVEPKAGWHWTQVTARRTAHDFAEVIERIVGRYRFARTIHLVLDNLNIHCRKSLIGRYGETKGGSLWSRITPHFTPKRGSWLNMAELELSMLSRECLGKRRIPDAPALQRETRAWSRRATRQPRTIQWSFTRQRARSLFGYEPIKTARSQY